MSTKLGKLMIFTIWSALGGVDLAIGILPIAATGSALILSVFAKHLYGKRLIEERLILAMYVEVITMLAMWWPVELVD